MKKGLLRFSVFRSTIEGGKVVKEHFWKISTKENLVSFLQRKLPLLFAPVAVSNSKIRRLIVAGSVFVNGRVCTVPSFSLRPGSEVFVRIDEERFFYEKQPDDIDFTLEDKDVLFEDESVIVVNKPAFLPTEETIVKGRGNMHQAVVDYLWKKNPALRNPPYAGIMHRLDRETSGTLLFTKTRTVNAAVHDMFENHTAKKCYRAVCFMRKKIKEGKSFSVENFIGRISPKSAQCKMGLLPASKGGQKAVTDFKVLSVEGSYAKVFCTLQTGRTHQIRVHLSLSDLPIAGDTLYGGPEGFPENKGRIMLHACSLEFPHPLTGKKVRVEAPLPPLF